MVQRIVQLAKVYALFRHQSHERFNIRWGEDYIVLPSEDRHLDTDLVIGDLWRSN
jgi:hypothetical protein